MAEKVRILTARPHRLLAPLIEELGRLNRQEKSVVLLVPEQLTLQTEREIFRQLQLEGTFYIDILSPSRFYERVLESGGRDQREPLNSAGRRMAVSLALERLEDKLGYYGAMSLRTGFVEKTAALITDLKRGGMTPETLAEYAERLPAGISREKLGDLALIYGQYEEVLRARFSDSEDQLRYVAGRLEDSGFLREKYVYVYGFDTLPDQMMRLLTAAAPLCENLSVALLWEHEDAADGELFLPIRQGVGRFTEGGDGSGVRGLSSKGTGRAGGDPLPGTGAVHAASPGHGRRAEQRVPFLRAKPLRGSHADDTSGASAAGRGHGYRKDRRAVPGRRRLCLCRVRRPAGQRHSLLHR